MMKIFVVWASFFIVLCLSYVSSKLDLSDRQFSLKSLSENTLQGHLYQPLEIHVEAIEKSFSDDKIYKALSSTLIASAKILSDLLLTKPSTEKVRFGENNQCADILLSQITQREDIDADIAIFAVSSKDKSEIITSRKCEVNEKKFIKAIALEINAEEFIKLEKISKVRELCIAIANVLYGDNEEENQVLMKEIGEYLANEENIGEMNKLGACNTGYFVSGGVCVACNPPCSECSGTPDYCTSCYDATNMINNAGTCTCNNSLKTFNTASLTCTCQAGYYALANGYCMQCSAPCATCTSYSNCITCQDPTNMTLNGGICTCTDPNKYFNSAALVCQCSGGYYSNAGVCTRCSLPCSTCSTSATYCTSCVDPIHMTPPTPTSGICACTDPNASYSTGSQKCLCNQGYYSDYSHNGLGVCTPCSVPCSSCSNSATSCTACVDPIHMILNGGYCVCSDPNASFNTVSLTCQCNPGYFSLSGVCTACGSSCISCSSSGCEDCYDPSNMTINGGLCVCKDLNAYFNTATNTCQCKNEYISVSGICQSCEAPCSQCENATTFCTECDDSNNMALDSASGACTCTDPNASFNAGTLTCQCNSGYLNYGGACTACIAPCSTCQSLPYLCTSCDDAANMVLMGSNCLCTDTNAYFNKESLTCQCESSYFSNSGVCTQCDATCSTCSGSAYFCTSCKDSNHMTLNSATGVCSCTDPNASFNQVFNLCQCNSGYISNLGVCVACVLPCATCSSSDIAFCTACEDPMNMYLNTVAGTCRCWDPYASFDQTSKTCQCIQGYYMSSSGACQPCIPPCAQCSNSETFCTACNDFANMNLNVTTGVCTCKEPNFQFNPWVKACQSNSSCNCNQCGTTINNFIFNF
ncbi:unnamed protein product [Blepharisma stoltei]|uniref:ShKT domain-containing protein n=1 Tax=Blepharisma stoltei TaxID=1481888 RepID=A0AAU9KDD8_9CILI|nr:unnamed protein product [Blepharisma stoltei]